MGIPRKFTGNIDTYMKLRKRHCKIHFWVALNIIYLTYSLPTITKPDMAMLLHVIEASPSFKLHTGTKIKQWLVVSKLAFGLILHTLPEIVEKFALI